MKKIVITILILIVLFVLYGFFINTKGLEIKEFTIESELISKSFNGFKIAHFSDILLGSTQTIEDVENVVNKINEMKADIIIFTGDLIQKDYSINDEEKEKLINLLTSLDCNLYKYAVIGDNDQSQIEVYEEIMTNSNFKVLNNDYTYLFYKDINPIKIIGLTNTDNINNLLNNEEGITPSYTILLTHYPDYVDNLTDTNINLILAGHSLGGQIKIPFVGSLLKKEKANKYIDDYYEVNNIKLYISSGLGTEKYNFRTFNKPSINKYRLNSIQKEES